MDNQQNNQNQSNQIPTNQEPPIPETQLPPIPETPAQPTPEIATEPILETPTIEETEDKDDDEKLTQQQSETQPTPEIATEPIPETSATEETGDEDNDEEFSQQPEVQSEPEIPETPQPEPILETQSESVDAAAAKYQQILDEYAASNKPSESEMQTTETPEPEQISSETELPSQPEANFEPEQLPPEPEIESEPNLPPISGSQYQTPVESIPNNQFIEDAPQANLFKLLFIISLFINIIVFSFAGLVYYKTTQNEDASNLPQITPEQESSITCSRDGKEYKVGEYFTHADGCNTCSCSEVGEIVCTEKACDITPATQSATKLTVTPTKTTTTTPSAQKVTPIATE